MACFYRYEYSDPSSNTPGTGCEEGEEILKQEERIIGLCLVYAKASHYQNDCNRIVTRGGVYAEILPEPEGFPEGSGNISSYTLT